MQSQRPERNEIGITNKSMARLGKRSSLSKYVGKQKQGSTTITYIETFQTARNPKFQMNN